jgi:UDP-N-acetylmuramate dehydrogenase
LKNPFIMTIDKTTKQWLKQTFGHVVVFDEPMSRHTYFRVGGPADAFVKPETLGELLELARQLRKNDVPYMVVGDGTNLLVKDGGIRGVVVSIGKCLKKIYHKENAAGNVMVTSGAGAKLRSLCGYAVKRGFQGINFAIGIPGTVGGGIMMNAGTKYGCISEALDAVMILGSGAKQIKIEKEKLNFSYRSLNWSSVIEDAQNARPIILEADFRLRASSKKKVREEADRYLQEKRLSQPTHEPSAGCFFKNPVSGKTAGQLIDMSGLKGRRNGGAEVSVEHANFIVNKGAATAKDILELKDIIQDTVFRLFQVKLETEVKIVGSSS